MKLYENVVIGNFLYGLGYSIGRGLENDDLIGAVNLLQQTPEDKLLGDVLLAFPGTLRLLEFKAKGSSLSKERSKHDVLSKALEGKPEMQKVSRDVHWYVETAPAKSSGVRAFCAPYLDALAVKSSSRVASALGLEQLIDTTAREVVLQKDQTLPQSVSDYLSLVRWCQGDGETGAGALICMVGKDGLHYVQLQDMRELTMQHDRWLEYRQALQQKLERQHDLDREGPEVKRGRGPVGR